jgi:hypothetical protein
MDDIGKLIERYVAMWNEPDPQARRRAIAELWSEDAAHYVRDIEYRGHARLEERVRSAHERFVGTGEHVFAANGDAQQRGNAIRFTWRMITAEGGAVAGAGCDFLVLAADGRIAADYQFPEPTPA